MEFNQPGTGAGDKIDMKALVGRLLLVYPKRIELGVQTQAFGAKDPLVADVVVLDGPNPGEQLHEVFIFPGALIGQLKHLIGNPNPVLGRLGYGVAKPGQNPPYELGLYDHTDEQTARHWLNNHPLGVQQPAQQTGAAAQPGNGASAYAGNGAAQQTSNGAPAQGSNGATAQMLPNGGYTNGGSVNTSTGEISGGAPAAVNIDTVRALLGLNLPDQAIADTTGATLEQVAAIRNLPVG
jgi:hypothetical protein